MAIQGIGHHFIDNHAAWNGNVDCQIDIFDRNIDIDPFFRQKDGFQIPGHGLNVLIHLDAGIILRFVKLFMNQRHGNDAGPHIHERLERVFPVVNVFLLQVQKTVDDREIVP